MRDLLENLDHIIAAEGSVGHDENDDLTTVENLQAMVSKVFPNVENDHIQYIEGDGVALFMPIYELHAQTLDMNTLKSLIKAVSQGVGSKVEFDEIEFDNSSSNPEIIFKFLI